MKNICKVENDILLYAFRYALGRRTFAPIIVVENIKNNIDKFSHGQIALIIKEIEEQASYGYGMDCDKETWLDFKEYLKGKLN